MFIAFLNINGQRNRNGYTVCVNYLVGKLKWVSGRCFSVVFIFSRPFLNTESNEITKIVGIKAG